MHDIFLPILADLAQEHASPIPAELLLLWEKGPKTLERQEELLLPFLVRGTYVCSDAAGLSKLSSGHSLIEVMQYLHEPKTVIFSLGAELGGEAIGLWSADNTAMFYEEHISPQNILSCLLEVQSTLQRFPVQTGIAMHTGRFYKIGNTLFGTEASMLEELAENHTAGGEVAVTEATLTHLDSSFLRHKKDVNFCDAYTIQYSPNAVLPSLPLTSSHYPFPFSEEFLHYIETYRGKELEIHKKELGTLLQQNYVLFCSLHVPKGDFFMDAFTYISIAGKLLDTLVLEFSMVKKVKISGSISIFCTKEKQEGIRFAQAVEKKLLELSLEITIGITFGEVLIFDIPGGKKDIAGSAVNIASKVAEDSGMQGVYVVETIQEESRGREAPTITFSTSGVLIHCTKI